MTLPSTFKPFLPLVLAITAIILGTAPSMQCETLKFPQLEENDVGHILLVGPWSYRTKYAREWSDQTFAAQTCNNYGKNGLRFDYEKDAKTDTVWAFSILTPVIGICTIILSSFRACFGGSGWIKGGYRCMAYSYLVTGIFQGLVLLISTSSLCYDNPALQYLDATNSELASTFTGECQIAIGFVFQAVAVALWILAAAAEFWVKDPVWTFEHPPQQQEVVYTQNVDGTIQETNVTIVKGRAVQ